MARHVLVVVLEKYQALLLYHVIHALTVFMLIMELVKNVQLTHTLIILTLYHVHHVPLENIPWAVHQVANRVVWILYFQVVLQLQLALLLS